MSTKIAPECVPKCSASPMMGTHCHSRVSSVSRSCLPEFSRLRIVRAVTDNTDSAKAACLGTSLLHLSCGEQHKLSGRKKRNVKYQIVYTLAYLISRLTVPTLEGLIPSDTTAGTFAHLPVWQQ